MPGGILTKTRWIIDVDGRPGAVDVFEGELAGLVLLEADLGGFDDLHSCIPPTWTGEVTKDETFTGGSLAMLSAAETTELLTPYE